MNVKQIYIIISGEYSDYCIEAVFDDFKLAEDFLNKLSPNQAWRKTRIETFVANPVYE